jgi:hypothetical protein
MLTSLIIASTTSGSTPLVFIKFHKILHLVDFSPLENSDKFVVFTSFYNSVV